ncbi:MAG TPA: hypothetical protein VLB09_03270, partial [Nitrospiria bacterium]|nr:hypothetical protein [Nitrospiria bacterium]
MPRSKLIFKYFQRSVTTILLVIAAGCGMEGKGPQPDSSSLEALGHIPGQTLTSIDVTPANLT